MYGNDDAPAAAVIDTSFGPGTYAPVPPGGRPPGRLGPYVGPATPTTVPVSPGTQASAESIKALQNGALLAGGLAVVVGLGLFLASDHAKVTAAREASNAPARKARKPMRKNRGRVRDDEDDDEDDEDDDDGT